MAVSNRALVGDALELVVEALEPFIASVLAPLLPAGSHWTAVLSAKDARAGITDPTVEPHDLMPMLRVLTERLGTHGFPFARGMPAVAATHANELRAWRNAWAHFRPLGAADTFRALDTAERLLRSIGAGPQADAIAAMMVEPFAALAAERLAKVPRREEPDATTEPDAEPARRLAVLERPGQRASDASTAVLVDAPVEVAVDAPVEVPVDALVDDEPAARAQPPVDAKAARIEEQDGASESDDVADALRKILAELTAPRALAPISQQLITQFGREVIEDWRGAGSFAKFVQRTEPRAEITGPQPGYVHPIGAAVPEGWEREQPDVPEWLRTLRTVDESIPLITWSRMSDTISAVIVTGPLDVPTFRSPSRTSDEKHTRDEQRARQAVAIAASSGRLISKAHVLWVIAVLRARHRTDDVLTERSASALIAEHMTELASRAGVDPERFRADVREWVGAGERTLSSRDLAG